jgi:ParB family chromosome partitioning protein
MKSEMKIHGEDVAIEKLVPLTERVINFKSHSGFKKILASIMAIGLIEPLAVYKENGRFVILDGFLRFKACQQLGLKTIPCMCYRDKEAYTFNKMVSTLSASQQSRMLRKSLRTIDESTIAKVFGIKSINSYLGNKILSDLHPKAINALDKEQINKHVAKELTYVTPDRQLQIVTEMEKNNDYSISLCRALIIKTPQSQRNTKKAHKRAWTQDSQKKQELVKKLESVGKRYDFYSSLYRQYATDLIKICVYIRKIITNDHIKTYLSTKNSEILERFEKIIFESAGSIKASKSGRTQRIA